MITRVATSIACTALAVYAVAAGIASAQQPIGLIVGQQVVWEKPEDPRSNYRGGQYAGTIERIDGSSNMTLLDDKAHYVKATLGQIRSVSCSGASWTLDPTGGGPKHYPVCQFTGQINGAYAIYDWGGGLMVRLSEPVMLRDGSTTDFFRSGIDSFGVLMVGQGHNRWAASGQPGGTSPGGTSPGASTGTTTHGQMPGTTGGTKTPGTTGGTTTPTTPGGTTPTKPGVTSRGGITIVPEVGQSYAQALNVGYPATVEAFMSQNDYDTYLFDFAGGVFHAHSQSALDLVADLLDAQGNKLAQARAVNGTFRFDQSLPAGRYGIIIRVMNYAGTGPYSLLLGTGAGPRYRERN